MKTFFKLNLLWQLIAGINLLASFLFLLPFMAIIVTPDNGWIINLPTPTKAASIYGGFLEFQNATHAFQAIIIWFGISSFVAFWVFVFTLSNPNNLIWLTTRLRKKVQVNTSNKLCLLYGVRYKDTVLFPNGEMGIVMGVGPDASGNNQLWLIFLRDNGRASYWNGWGSAEDMEKYGIKILK